MEPRLPCVSWVSEECGGSYTDVRVLCISWKIHLLGGTETYLDGALLKVIVVVV